MQQVFISLGAFGAAEVRRHGQLWFARLARAAGADGVEVRGELLTDAATELPAIARAAREDGSALVYSSPEGLWDAGGVFDRAALTRALDAAQVLCAPRLKMSIGGYGRGSADALPQLAQALRARGTELVIENDQTVAAGTLGALQPFFAQARTAGLPLGMTFDMGNWHWTGDCPLEAARSCGPQVVYVHCKGVQRQPQRWIAVPLADSAAPWRTVLRTLPRGLPWAIEYPLQGDDLLAVTREHVAQLREVAATLGSAA
ncbi:MAG: sugar phosphate isomerase/epimerase family protein [Ramlibacter sp.]